MEDCYFFLYSTCLKGPLCPFRHQESCKSNLSICQKWQSGSGCTDLQCPQRHSLYHLQKQRSSIPCYWEANGGCQKAHCPFLHVLPKALEETSVSGNCMSMRSNEKKTVEKEENFSTSTLSFQSTPSLQSSTLQSTSDSIHSHPWTAKRSTPKPDRLALKRQRQIIELKKDNQPAGAGVDFEVKSLEQIMREKRQISYCNGEVGNDRSLDEATNMQSANAQLQMSIKEQQSVNMQSTYNELQSKHMQSSHNEQQSKQTQSSHNELQSKAKHSPFMQKNTSDNESFSLIEDIDRELEEMNKLLG